MSRRRERMIPWRRGVIACQAMVSVLALIVAGATYGQSSEDNAHQHDMPGMEHDKDMHHDHTMQHSGMGPESAAKQPQKSDGDTESQAEHIPPDPPQHPMPAMPYRQMAAMMQMDDRSPAWQVLLDEFEYRDTKAGPAGEWVARGYYGGDYNKLWVRTEGEHVRGATEDARAEVFWDRIITRWWSVQAGAREDFGEGPPRTWAALGVQGLAPYWFDVEATIYAGSQGRTAARLRTEYDLLLTQRLILQPEVELNLYGKADPARRLGSGLSDLDAGIRLRYEIRHEFAPYVGFSWVRRFGGTADFARATADTVDEVEFVAGIRAWF